MSDKSVDDVLQELEKVFSGENEYDDCLMNLELHVAQVRKNYPNLYNVLKRPPKTGSKEESVSANSAPAVSIDDLRKVLSEVSAANRPVAAEYQQPIPSQVQMPPAPPPEPPKAIKYSTWQRDLMKTSQVGQEWLLEWDLPQQVPMPDLGGPLTPKSEFGRHRFTVIGIDPDSRRFKVRYVSLLPNNDN